MREFHDQLAKAVLKASLSEVTRFEANREISGFTLRADVWAEPLPERKAELGVLGTLGRMIELGPCLLEPFSGVPRTSDIRSCLLKQFALDHAQRRDSRVNKQPWPPFPLLWIIASGSPDSLIKAMAMSPMDGWPIGCYHREPFDAFHLVVVRKLPKTPETLFLRLLGRGESLAEAARELSRLRGGVPPLVAVAGRVIHELVVFGHDFAQDQLTEEDMEALRDIRVSYEEWERQAKAEGEAAGKAAGKAEGEAAGKAAGKAEGFIEANRKTLRSLCQGLNIELTQERVAQMEAWDAEQLEAAIVKVGTTHEWPSS